MKMRLKFGVGAVAAVCSIATYSQAIPVKVDPACLTIQVAIDEVPLKEPVTLLIGRGDEMLEVPFTEKCFRLPETWLAKQDVAVRVDIGQNSLFFGGISTGNFDCPWDISLSNKRGKIKAGSHRYRKNVACFLNFRKGEPGFGIQVAPCRAPRKPSPITAP